MRAARRDVANEGFSFSSCCKKQKPSFLAQTHTHTLLLVSHHETQEGEGGRTVRAKQASGVMSCRCVPLFRRANHHGSTWSPPPLPLLSVTHTNPQRHRSPPTFFFFCILHVQRVKESE
jgi:hypothetical protein